MMLPDGGKAVYVQVHGILRQMSAAKAIQNHQQQMVNNPAPIEPVLNGGLTNNILAPMHVSKHHAEAVLSLGVAPSSLLKLCLELITSKKEMFSKEVEELPQYLKKIVKIRCSSGA